MGLLDFLSGGGNGAAPDLYAGALTPDQQAAMRQQALAGAMGGLLKSGALDYTVPFISGKVPGGFAAGLAGAAAGAQDATNNAAGLGMKAQEFVLNRNMLQQKLGLLGKYMQIAAGGGADETGPTGPGAPPEAGGGQSSGQSASSAELNPAPAKGALGIPQLYDLAVQAGYQPGQKAATAAAISFAESRGNPAAHNTKGEDSRGLMQINADAWGPLAVYDPLQNMQNSLKISQGGTNFSPWSTFKNGAFDQYMPAAMAAAKASASAAPIRLAQNGPPTSLPAAAAPGGPAMGGTPAAPGSGAPASAQAPPAAPQAASGSIGLFDTGPVTGLLQQPAPPQTGLLGAQASANPGIPPIAQPQPPAAAAPAAPGGPGYGLTPAQLAEARRMRALSLVGSLMDIKNPAWVDQAAGLPLVGPEAAAKAAAEAPYKFNAVRPGSVGGYGTNMTVGGPQLIQTVNPDGSKSYAQLNPATGKVSPVGAQSELAPQAKSQQEETGKNTANAQTYPIGGTLGQPGAASGQGGQMPAIQGSPLAPGITSKIPAYQEPSYTPDERNGKKWDETTADMVQAGGEAQVAERRLKDIAGAFKMIQTGAFTTDKAQWNAALQSVFGKDAWFQFSNASPGDVETALHSNYIATLQRLGAVNKRFTQREFAVLSDKSEHPNLQPEPNLTMLSEDIGQLRQLQGLSKDWVNARISGQYHNPNLFRGAWLAENELDPIVQSVRQEIGPLKGMPGGPGNSPPANQPNAGRPMGGTLSNGMRWSVPQ